MADPVYTKYIAFLSHMNELSFQTFKIHPDYTTILKHVSEEQGETYLTLLRGLHLSETEIMNFCTMNDLKGTPNRYIYELKLRPGMIDYIPVSPASLRYLYHAHLILTHFTRYQRASIPIVEIGGGYGGLCLAIHFLLTATSYFPAVSISSYTMIDLPDVLSLQTKYLSHHHSISFPVSFVSANTYGKSVPEGTFLISNDCFSVLDPHHQKEYLTHLFPKLVHGFMAWNRVPFFPIGKSVNVFPEEPQTGKQNLLVSF